MAVIEIAFPALKTDKASLDELERLLPILIKLLTQPNPGLSTGSCDCILSKNDQDLREAFREVLLFGQPPCKPDIMEYLTGLPT
jgi:hypothetical protein